MEHFTVKHYIGDDRPTLKGNGFDGLEVGRTREDAQDFVTFLNAAIDAAGKGSMRCTFEAPDMSRAFEAPDMDNRTLASCKARFPHGDVFSGVEPQMGGNDAAIREAAVRASAQMPKDDGPGSLVFAARHALSDLRWAQATGLAANFQSSILLLEAALKGRV